MSLLRLAFWLALLVLLLPTDAQQQARFGHFANGAYQRAATFCDRNPGTCDAASGLWASFVRKAEFGLRLVGDLIGAGNGRPDRAGLPPGPPPERRYGRPPPRGVPPDLYRRPAWRGGPMRPPREGYY